MGRITLSLTAMYRSITINRRIIGIIIKTTARVNPVNKKVIGLS